MAATEDQERRLIGNLRQWVGMLDSVSKSVAGFVDDFGALYEGLDFDDLSAEELGRVRETVFGSPASVHILVICLRHIDGLARELESASVWKDVVAWRGKEFRRLVSSKEARRLSNVLEHSAEYLAGHGKYPEMVVNIDDDWPGFLGGNGRVHKIHVFGRQYDVGAVISAAFEFAKVLPRDDQVDG